MAEIAIVPCTKNERGHCWHANAVPMMGQLYWATHMGDICCWCGEKRTAVFNFHVPLTHGAHEPKMLVTPAQGGKP